MEYIIDQSCGTSVVMFVSEYDVDLLRFMPGKCAEIILFKGKLFAKLYIQILNANTILIFNHNPYLQQFSDEICHKLVFSL